MKGMTEFELTCQVAAFLKLALPKGSRFSHLPCGEHRTAATAGKLKRMGVTKGVPDFLIAVPPMATRLGVLSFLELKSEKGKPSEDQREWGGLIQDAQGGNYDVCRTLVEVERSLRELGIRLNASVEGKR